MKKALAILFLLCMSNTLLYGQKRDLKNYFKFNETALSINKNDDSNASLGFGLAAYKIRKKNQLFSYVWGLEYNKSSKEVESLYLGSFGTLSDVAFNFHKLLIPMGYRFHVGHQYKLVLSGSIFLDMALHVNIEASENISNLDPENAMNSSRKISENADVSFLAFGFMYGAGFSVPIYDDELLFQLNRVFSFRDVGDEKDSVLNFYTRFSIAYRWRV